MSALPETEADAEAAAAAAADEVTSIDTPGLSHLHIVPEGDKGGTKKISRKWLTIFLVALMEIGAFYAWQQGYLDNILNTSKAAVQPIASDQVKPQLSLAEKEKQALDRLRDQAMQHYRADNLRESRSIWEQIILKDPLNPENYNNLGLVFKKLGRWEDAIAQYQKALRLDAKYVTSFNNLGSLYLSRGDYSHAYRFLQKAIALDPSYADPYLNLGFLLEQRGDFNGAKDSYQKFLSFMTSADDPIRNEVQMRMDLLTTAAQEAL